MLRPSLAAGAMTIIILTKDEAARLPRCLAAIPLCYPVVVVDQLFRVVVEMGLENTLHLQQQVQ